jgi:hypothetical protein
MAGKIKDTQVRCIGCGMPVVSSQQAAQLLVGRMDEDNEFGTERVFGTLHRSCFDRTIESPKSVLEEIKRLSKRGSSLRA